MRFTENSLRTLTRPVQWESTLPWTETQNQDVRLIHTYEETMPLSDYASERGADT
jgi:hypothetical protein